MPPTVEQSSFLSGSCHLPHLTVFYQHMPTLAHNKKALADYRVVEELEAGIALTGPEVKSVKAGSLNLRGSYISIDQKPEAWLVGATISKYPPAAAVQIGYDPIRRRRLLLKNKEMLYLLGKQHERGLTIIPISVYTKGGLIKVKVAIASGKKQFDKRQDIKKREVNRSIRHNLKTWV
jgi:SsrA-binding protein